MKKIASGLKKLSSSFRLSWDRKDAANSEGSTTPAEDSKESFEEFSKRLDEDLKELCVKRMDSNGFVHSAGEDNSQIALPSKSGKSMKYFLSEKIGEGAYGKVYRSVDTITKEECAIKISKLTDENRGYLLDEMDILKKLKSRYIVAVYEGFIVGSKLWLVMEHCVGGSILDVMKMCKINALKEPLMKGVIAFLLLALDYLHSHHIIHRDIKASNLVLTMGGKVKLIDFGVSTEIKDGENSKSTVIGSPYWMAPEVIEGKDYSENADVWSLGMTMLELCEPKHPLFCIHPVSVLFKIVTADPPQLQSSYETFSIDFSKFVSRCMQKDPAQRPSSKALLDDKWIRDTVNVIVNVDEDNPTSCVVALEQLFMRYMMDDDVQTLTWDAEDDLNFEQEDNELEKNDKKSTSSLISPQLLALHHQAERLDSGDQASVSSKSHSKTSEDKSVSATTERPPLSQSNQQHNDKSVDVEALPAPDAVSSSGAITIGIGSLHSLNRRVSFASDVSADEVSKEPFRHINLHAHPNSLDSTMPSMSDTPPSLRHFNSQSYIKRMIAETGQERPKSSSYRSLGSFEDTLILSNKSVSTTTSHGSMRNHDKVSLSSSSRGLSMSVSSSGSSFQSV